MSEEQKTDEQKAVDQIRAVYEDGKAEINGRTYTFGKMQHKNRRKVFAFFTKVQGDINAKSFWFLESPEFEQVEEIIHSHTLFNGDKLSNIDNHWDKYPGDYITFVSTALAVISYPFMDAAITG